MATLALGVVGAAVGFYFGGPTGASLGWAAGAYLGGRIEAKGTTGPRLTDLRAQTSSYGQPIPIGHGTIRIAGNCIWAADKVEHKHKSGGKGGPKVTTYSYTQSFAIGLLETSFIDGAGVLVNNPIVGILRIWADSRLIYGEGSAGTSLPMTIYYGTEDQEADPTIEAEEGAGDVPAHRGMAYVVFTDLELGGFGNRIPNLTFEVVASGAIGLEFYAQWPVDWSWATDGQAYSFPYTLNGVQNTADGLVLNRYRSGFDYGASMGTGDDSILYYDRKVFDLKGTLLTTDTQVVTNAGGSILHLYGSLNSDIGYVIHSSGTFGAWLKAGVDSQLPPGDKAALPIEAAPIYFNGYVYAAGGIGSGDMILRRWPAPDGAVYTAAWDGSGVGETPIEFNADAQRTGYPASLGWFADAGELIVGDDGYLYWCVGYHSGGDDGTRLFKLDADLNLIGTPWWTGLGAVLTSGGTQGGGATIYRGHIIAYKEFGIIDTSHANFIMHKLNADGTTTFVTELRVPSTLALNNVSSVYYIGGGLAAVRQGILRLGSTGVTLASIVANVSEHVGFDSAEVDVDQLTDMVRGYAVTTRMSGRAAIEALQPVYQFGAVESNLQAKFVKWGGLVMETVTSDYLGAREGDSDPGDPLEITHLDDAQLPQRIELVYLNLDMDYQEGMQYAARTASASDITVAVSAPVVLIDAEAKSRVDALDYNAWIERDKFKFSLPRKFAHWEPTDVHNVDGHAVRITNKDEQGYTHINFDGVATRVGVFINGPVAVPAIGFVPQVPPTLNRTDLLLLDLPLVAETDFANGFYGAIAGRMEGAWPGMGLFKSIDGGVNYDSVYSTVEPDTFGIATTELGNFLGGNIFDEMNAVTVRLTPGSGELSSSNELGVLNGANLAAIGSEASGYELIQFKTATLTAARTYVLTGLLRGRRGTEWALDTHAVGDNFILQPCHNIEGAFAELQQARLYKAVSSGGLLASSSAVAFTNTGVALKCLSPCHLGGGRNAAGDITLNWTRRTRIGGGWINGTDVPLSEASEQYTMVIFSNSGRGTVKRALLVNNAQTYTYVAADQTTDFGGLQTTLYWNVAQNGAAGEGYEAEGTT